MLFKLYSLNKTRKAWQENPSEELSSTLQSTIIGYLATSFIVGALIMALLGVLSFTQVLGGPYLLARILFVLAVIPFLISLIVLGRLLRFIRSTITGHRSGKSDQHASATIIDVEAD